jgi:uncharacterized protein YneF (UPF0154 family)
MTRLDFDAAIDMADCPPRNDDALRALLAELGMKRALETMF